MNTTKQTIANNLTEFAQLLKDNGFTVIVPKKYDTWIYFFKDGKFGSVSKDRISGFGFSSVHKPCQECGTGFRMVDEDFAELTIENANTALLNHPSWARHSDIKAIRKYSTVEEFINSSHNKWAEYSIL